MSERYDLISRLENDLEFRVAYIQSKLSTLVPAQIRALRLKSDMPRQKDLANAANMQQSRISMFETPGSANVTEETLCRLAAAFGCGLKIEFVTFSEMLRWENGFVGSGFNVTRLWDDIKFLSPRPVPKIKVVSNVLNPFQPLKQNTSIDRGPIQNYETPILAHLFNDPVGGGASWLTNQNC